MYSVSEIISGLWLGDVKSSQSESFVKNANIKLIINATDVLPNVFNNINYYRVSVNDPGPCNDINQIDNQIMYEKIPIAIKLIDDYLKNNYGVLVHCRAGMQRSATIVLAYLMTYIFNTKCKSSTLRNSIHHIISKRPLVFNYGRNASFKPAISKYLLDL